MNGASPSSQFVPLLVRCLSLIPLQKEASCMLAILSSTVFSLSPGEPR